MLLLLKFLKKYKVHSVIALVATYMVAFGGVADLSYLLGANSLGMIGHDEFNGTVYPYEAAADWVALQESERELSYSQLSSSKKIAPLKYNEDELAIDFGNLNYGSKDGDRIRNSKITYSVPYLGTYKLDGKAGTGSHGAVDIKLHMDTPIFAIANGIVTKVEEKQYGFGKYIVIRHNNVPDVDNPEVLTSYVSSYSHMNSFKVKAGDVVKKGQLIGFSGNTGTSTTPHLHFQIDTIDAPFHPYWPFNNADLNEAGMSFFEGVNNGLKQENAKKYTISPLKFVEANLNYKLNEETKKDDNKDEPREDEQTALEEDEVKDSTVEIKTDSTVDNSFEFDFVTPEFVVLGEEFEVVLESNSDFATASGSEVGNLKVISDVRADIEYSERLAKGSNRILFTGKELGEVNLTIEIDNETYELPKFEVRPFKDVSAFDKDVREFTSLKKARIVEGIDGNLMPEKEVTRAASLKFLVETLSVASPRLLNDIELSDVNFADTSDSDWFNEYIRKSVALNSVTLDQENFNPQRSVIMPELLKMFFEGMNADIDENISESLNTEFDTTTWYAKYVQEALDRNIINTDDLKDITKPLTRRDVAIISYKFLSLIETGRYAY